MATEIESYEPELWETDAPVDLKPPLHGGPFPKGTRVGSTFFDGQSHRCVFWGLESFEPPIDDEGRGFPTVCFEDRDNDGSFETLVLYAYKAQPGKGIVETKVAPVHLKAHPQPVAPRPFMTVYRRLRVLSVDRNSATFAVEFATVFASPRMSTEPTFQQATSIPAQLHEGPLAVAGIDLNVIKVAGQWSATPTGHASAWVTLECGASKVTLAN